MRLAKYVALGALLVTAVIGAVCAGLLALTELMKFSVLLGGIAACALVGGLLGLLLWEGVTEDEARERRMSAKPRYPTDSVE